MGIGAEMTPLRRPSVSFAGCGFIGVYQIGATAALRQFAPYLLQSDILGSSSGALIAISLVANMSLEEFLRSAIVGFRKVTDNVFGPFSPSLDLTEEIKKVWVEILPEDIAERLSGRLHISMTKVPSFSNILVNQFLNKADLIDALICSSWIPMVGGWLPPKFRGDSCIDGFYSNNMPTLSKETITVTVFSGEASICPHDEDKGNSIINLNIPQGPHSSLSISWKNTIRLGNTIVPPATRNMIKVSMQGYDDAVKFLLAKDLIKCDQCITTSSTNSSCGLCQMAKTESLTKTLPETIIKVFEESIEEECPNEKQNFSSYIYNLPVSMWQAAFCPV
eukprot:GFUD01110005.1.p1 GENE.GFUD01110005.1~~GFUD01110005.1.p1  ORF type:complete len:335 (+),score=70.95 GFUD01110005.1:39-1043(+)